ncbi:MAG: thioredoxin family protein [Acidiferrobacterales bacterium]
MKRIHHLTLGLLFVLMAAPVWAEILPLASDLQQDGKTSERDGTPIMIFYMSTSCAYCEEVKDLYLEPMVRSGQYKGRLIIRMVDIEGSEYLSDFSGKRMDHEEFADDQGVSFTPVLKFYDHQGKELVPELLGYSSPDFYLAYLESAIETSISKLRPDSKTAKANTGLILSR